MGPSRTRLRPRLAGLSRGLQHLLSALRGKTRKPTNAPGGVSDLGCVIIKNLDWTTANIMLASTLMWASSAPMMLLILGVFDVLALASGLACVGGSSTTSATVTRKR